MTLATLSISSTWSDTLKKVQAPNQGIGKLVTPGGRGAATKKAECGPAAMFPFGQMV